MRRAGLALALFVVLAMPVGAGASGHASLAMLAFAGLFLLGNAALRPGSVRLDQPGALVAQGLMALACAALLVSLGQTIRALGQIEAVVPLFGWVFAAAWGMVLARVVWRPRYDQAAGARAETALRVVHRSGTPKADGARQAETGRGSTVLSVVAAPDVVESTPPPPEDVPALRPADPDILAACRVLDTLSETEPDADRLREKVRALAASGAPGAITDALAERCAETGAERDRRALALHTLTPEVATGRLDEDDARVAFEAIVAAADAGSLGIYVTEAETLVAERPDAAGYLPPISRLLEIADQIEGAHEGEAEALVSLAQILEDLVLEEGNGADA